MGKDMIDKIPIGIKSCSKNLERRVAIEHTWLSKLDNIFFPIFLIGRKGQPAELVGNILYLDCDDHYQGLSGKMKEFYKWALQHTSASHFWSCDDDSYINTELFNRFEDYKNYDYSGSFIYGIEKKENTLSGYTSGCGMCVSRDAAEVCVQHLPNVASDDDVSIGNVLNANMQTLKKLHIQNIHPWSYLKDDKQMLIGHYIHGGKATEKNFYQSMKKMHDYYHIPILNEKINIEKYLTGKLNREYQSEKELETYYNIDEKNIHFIWIGSNIPEKYVDNILKCKELNPDYKIYVWLDKQASEKLLNNVTCEDLTKFKSMHEEILNTISSNAGKADILRYEIVYQYGGIYSDVDVIFVKPFDDNFNKSFVSHINGYYNICNGCFGFNKGSKFLKFVLDCFPENFKMSGKDAWLPELSGPTFFTTCFVQYNDKNINTLNQKFLIFNNSYSYCYHTMDKNW